MAPHRLDRATARRLAVRAQLLDARRPTDLLAVVDRLTFLQIDPTAAVAPNADLVAWTRLGAAYRPAQLTRALEDERALFEHRAMIRPMTDLRLHLADMAAWPPEPRRRDWLAANDTFRRYVLDRLRDAGPLLSRDVEDRSVVPWPSTGWTNNRNVTQMLEFLAARGEIAIAGRIGRQRTWDLAERVYPAGTPTVPAEEARRARDERLLRSLGVARPLVVGEAGEPAEIEGTSGPWRVDPAALDGAPFAGRTALLSPFDRLVHDRKRALELFDFDYRLEMYVPKAQRRWGYFALPVLHHDRLVGKVDVTADRKGKVLRVDAIHQDVPFTPELTAAVHAELAALASWLDLPESRLP
ncbi:MULTISPECIES: DNA glycosylase AlkZ-like family protein [Micromonospora]|uniref:Winged helix-turn-helix domain-containing protein n=1 Tax=Micromonospora solifontis TaxID=2487138 RepID=A0ABX9WFJ1_9ACTN|nr:MULTISPECIES: crosslink repair DNA glycosylase YcaQ family protein [Micromonospora]NES13990.1 winged helix-turn-helix domain-containing protein [Micromonospora sp. PPF5-17B]NES37121.1 winged helix-turn-helix domain-containing protein [Micromonospora solifontis]NES54090.1 winged helix-turn-helix domain-containing protein [Micromonospora sp. PPF5-6]RNL98676.1 winged helix-turn-helix domain-containing protein [Micromonospora solifontis]